jgi:hypothetical protein
VPPATLRRRPYPVFVRRDDPEATWTWVDAWLLAATADSRRGCSLSELIGAADAINHAIPTRDELAASLGSLRAAGLVEQTEGRFRTTTHGKALKEHWRGGLFGWGKSLLPHLENLPRPGGDLPITESEVHAAYVEYTRRH